MNTKIQKTLLAGCIGTAIMSLFMLLAPVMGMPKMSPPKMLSAMLGMPVVLGWIMHFIIGILFALAYSYLSIYKHKINHVWLKGVVFGSLVFVFAQMMMGLMSAMMPMPKMEAPLILSAAGSLVGHLIFGIVVVTIVGRTSCVGSSCQPKAV